MATEVENSHTYWQSEMPWENALRGDVYVHMDQVYTRVFRSIISHGPKWNSPKCLDGLRKDRVKPRAKFTIAGMNSHRPECWQKETQMQLVQALKQTGRTQSVVQGYI